MITAGHVTFLAGFSSSTSTSYEALATVFTGTMNTNCPIPWSQVATESYFCVSSEKVIGSVELSAVSDPVRPEIVSVLSHAVNRG